MLGDGAVGLQAEGLLEVRRGGRHPPAGCGMGVPRETWDSGIQLLNDGGKGGSLSTFETQSVTPPRLWSLKQLYGLRRRRSARHPQDKTVSLGSYPTGGYLGKPGHPACEPANVPRCLVDPIPASTPPHPRTNP